MCEYGHPETSIGGLFYRVCSLPDFAQDRAILLRELSSSPPALLLRPLLTNLGIRVKPATAPGVATACPTTKTIRVGGVDQVAHRGPYAAEVREYTSALAWGFAHLRLAAMEAQAEARAYAAAFLCPLELLELAPELPAIRRGSGVDGLAKRLAVASWVVEEALRRHQLVDRLLHQLPTKRSVHDGGTISRSESVPQREAMGGPA